jgi:hypothetical protein
MLAFINYMGEYLFMIFEMDQSSIKKLSKFFKESPKLFQQASANVLNNLAFQTRKNDIRNLSANLIIRNKRFLESSIIVQKAKPVSLEKQVAIVATLQRGGFTGWAEQEGRSTKDKPRTSTLAARGGNKRGVIKQQYRLRRSNKFYKPESFAGKNIKQQFGFMMKVLNTRGNAQFLLSHDIQTKRGTLGKGLYSLQKHKIMRVQTFKSSQIKQYRFRTESIKQLRFSTDIKSLWQEGINRAVNKYK